MASTTFAVVYGGPLLEDGSMPIRDLAPALLALGELFVETSVVAYPDQEPVSLNIRATEEGSFLVDLAIHSPDTWDQIVHLFSSNPITALVNIKELVIGGGFSLFGLTKALRRKRIEKVDESHVESGHVRLTLENGTVLEIPAEVWALYRNVRVRRHVKEVVNPLRRDGIEKVEFITDEKITVSISQDEADAFDVPEQIEVPLGKHETELVVQIASVAFVEGNKWRLSDGESSFYAAIEDESFLERIEAGEAFRKGDMLRCHMLIEQSRVGESLRTEHHVIEVLQHIPGPVQLTFEELSGDDE